MSKLQTGYKMNSIIMPAQTERQAEVSPRFMFRSTFLPRMLGVLLALAGVAVSLPLLYPPLATYLSPYNLVVDGVGEVSLLLWLLFVGVNEARRKEQASKAGERP